MSQFGDVLGETLAKLGGKNWEEIRLMGNQIQAASQSIRQAPSGGLSGDVFVGQTFNVLPHEAAGLVTVSAAQSIPADTYTDVAFTDEGSGGALTTFGYQLGLRRDYATGTISLAGVPAGSLVAISWGIQWVANSSGLREVTVNTSDIGSTLLQSQAAVSGAATRMVGSLVWQTATLDVSVGLRVWQNSGAALDIQFRHLTVARLR